MMGDKSTAKQTMRDAGVPLVPGSADRLSARRRPPTWPPSVGYPVLLKAAAGGGGRGMRLVRAPGRARGGVPHGLAPRPRRRSATAACTSRRRWSSRATSRCRCWPTQHGGVLVLGERDCSIQRRHQKLIEEGAVAGARPPTRARWRRPRELACRACDYVNAGTVEFLLDAEGGSSSSR